MSAKLLKISFVILLLVTFIEIGYYLYAFGKPQFTSEDEAKQKFTKKFIHEYLDNQTFTNYLLEQKKGIIQDIQYTSSERNGNHYVVSIEAGGETIPFAFQTPPSSNARYFYVKDGSTSQTETFERAKVGDNIELLQTFALPNKNEITDDFKFELKSMEVYFGNERKISLP